jgi:hypothetical protein
VAGLPIDNALKYESGLSSNTKPMWIFLIALVGLTFWSFSENLSLIPLGLSVVHDGGTKCLELDLFYNLVIDWTY